MRKRWLISVPIILLLVGLGVSCIAGGVFRSTFAWPNPIDPAVVNQYSSLASCLNMYDTLVYPDVHGNPLPHAASDWEVSEDFLVWTFHLRDDIVFHDGTPLTARDVVYSMERMLTIGQGLSFLYIGKVKNIEALDDYTVSITLSSSFGPFLSTLYRLYILNKDLMDANTVRPGAYGENGDYGTGYLIDHDAGSGPYILKEFRVEEELVMTKNPHYWIPIDADAPDEVRFIGTTEAVTIRTMMSRNELEISDQWQTQEALKALDGLEGIDIASFSSGSVFYIMINTRIPPTDDIHFRKAMAWATDYATVVDYIFPGSPQARGPVPQNIPGADPSVFQYYRDLDKAREELALSKYSADDYEVEFHWIAEVPDEEKVALSFMSNMADIGINIKVVKVPWMSVVEEMGTLETSPHIVSVFDASHFPEAGSLLESRYHSNSVATWEQNEWLENAGLDALLGKAFATVDQDLRFAYYSAIQHYIVGLCPTIFLFEQIEEHAYAANRVEWPAAEGEAVPVMGYNLAARFIKVD